MGGARIGQARFQAPQPEVIEARWAVDSAPAALAESQAVLDSIRIEP